jgi:hypothetical protein
LDAGGLGTGVEDIAGVDLLGGAGGAFGLDAVARRAGVEAVAGGDLLGGARGAFGLDAGRLRAGVEAVAELDVVGVATALAGVVADEVVSRDEPPQPANARRPTARVNVESLDRDRSDA